MGAGFKRKDVLDQQVRDDFSDFSLSSPATKIRRLDAELPPIPEMLEEEEEEALNPNEERALVVFNPFPTHSPFSFTIHPYLLSGINNNWSKQYDSDCDFLMRSQEEEKKKQRLALVPWVSPSSSNSHDDDSTNTNTEEPHAEMGDMDMEIEQQEDMDSIANIDSSTSTIHPLNLHHAVSGITPEGFHQWQQQHCFLPQFPQNTSTPITWTR